MYLSKLIIVGIITLSILFVQIQASFEEDVLMEHNKYRAKHGSPKLKLDASLSADCQSYAETLASFDKMVYSDGNYGENLCYLTWNPVSCVKLWYDEVRDYRFDKAEFSVDTRHFTQLVWKATTKMGVGKKESQADGSLNKIYVVARYKPAGNVKGEFASNISRPRNSKGNKASISKYYALLYMFPALFSKLSGFCC